MGMDGCAEPVERCFMGGRWVRYYGWLCDCGDGSAGWRSGFVSRLTRGL